MDPTASSLRSVFLQKSQGRPGACYDPVQKLGEGAFGVAHLVRDKRTAALRVLKTINKRQSQVPPGQLEKEIHNLKACDHPHIVRLFEYYEDYENIYLVMEHAEGGELHQVLEAEKQKGLKLPERWVAQVIKQCLMAVAHVHAQGIIHKDLKSENILLLRTVDPQDPQEPPHAVIIDLGIGELFAARLGRKARCTVVAGTPTHMAPEVWRGSFGPVADVWSLGVVMFELLAGDIPFLCSSLNSAQEWLRQHRQGPNWSLVSHVSKQARAINQRMLNWDERMRPTAQQCLGHAWIKDSLSGAGHGGEEPTATAEEAETPEDANRAAEALQLQPELPSARRPPSQDVVHALHDYVGRSHFEKAVLLQVASQCHLAQVSRVSEVFAAADVDGDGTVTQDELVACLGKLDVEPAVVESFVACVDVNSNGRIEYTEFVSSCVALLYESLRDLLWQSFCVLDIDGNGVLSRGEICTVLNRPELSQCGFPGCDPSASVQEAMARMDVDGNGLISFEELCRVFLPRRPLGPRSEDPALGHGPPGRSMTKAMHDEDFAQFLDQIEADHAATAGSGLAALEPEGLPLPPPVPLPPPSRGLPPSDGGPSEPGVPPGDGSGAPSVGLCVAGLQIESSPGFDGTLNNLDVSGLAGGFPPPVAGGHTAASAVRQVDDGRTVEEELSSLLADLHGT